VTSVQPQASKRLLTLVGKWGDDRNSADENRMSWSGERLDGSLLSVASMRLATLVHFCEHWYITDWDLEILIGLP
jgi:hypothetical protein